MSSRGPQRTHSEPHPAAERGAGRRLEERLLSSGLQGIAAVTLATVVLAAGGALIAFIVSLLFQG